MSPLNQPDLRRIDPADKLARTIARRRMQPIATEAPAQVTFAVPPAEDAVQPAPASRKNRMLEHLRLIFGPGRSLKNRVRAVPLIGRLAVWANAVVHINTLRRQLEQTTAMSDSRLVRLEAMNIDNRLARLEAMNIDNRLARVEALDVAYRLSRLDALDISDRLHAFDAINIANRLNGIEAAMEAEQRRDIERDNRIAMLTRDAQGARQDGRTDDAKATAAAVAVSRDAYDFGADRFYTEFEASFRGTRDDIRERQKIYLPYLEQVLARIEPRGDARVVDVGCGRGEWLELLASQGIRATGIDLNREMIAACKELGFDAEFGDAIAYLRQQPKGSLAAVTGFQVIEHLPFDQLIALFDAAAEALRPEGVVIFETPNPENVSVGSCSFYYDPTHRNPIAPAVAEFIARQRGFAKAEIVRANSLPAERLITESTEVAQRFNSAFYGAQDYAVVAWKTYAP